VVVLGVVSVADVASPRPAGWVTDQAHVVDAASARRLDTIAERLHTDRSIELAVVTVDDVPGTPKQFATELFNRWGIGSSQTHNGVLVLLVMAKRRLEIETGRGIEAALTAAWLADMQRVTMVPRLKSRDFAGGLVAGVEAIDEHLRAAPAETTSTAPPGEYRSDGAPTSATGAADRTRIGAAVPVADPAPAPATAGASSGDGLPVGGLLGAGTVLLGGAGGLALRAARRRQRTCFRCQPPRTMLMLDEIADDAHLDAGQRTEERIGSVEYEVLVCPGCQASRTLRRGRWFSGHDTCDGCAYKTSRSTSTTLVEATYDQGGEIEVVEACKNCNRHHRYTRSTPARTRPSTSSSSTSYSSSSPSSSGFSGGSSSGGGAGSSW
jgi:uncharacterized protein